MKKEQLIELLYQALETEIGAARAKQARQEML
jgi:hypothetical protein